VRPLAPAPPAAPLPRRSEVEAFWNSFSCDHSIAVLQSVPAFLLQTPGGDPSAPAQVARSRMLPESMKTGPVAHRPVPFLGQAPVIFALYETSVQDYHNQQSAYWKCLSA
jgi:hypothetical protein